MKSLTKALAVAAALLVATPVVRAEESGAKPAPARKHKQRGRDLALVASLLWFPFLVGPADQDAGAKPPAAKKRAKRTTAKQRPPAPSTGE